MRRAGGPRILVALGLTNLIAYAMRNSLFAVYPDLRDLFGLRDAKLGLLTTVFLIPHAIATLPFGWAGDRYDRRRVIALGMLLASVAGAAGALAQNTTQLAISRALLGFGTAAVVPVANSILGQLYEGPHKASRMAIFNLGLLLGGVAGFGVGAIAGFPAVVVVLAIPGVVLALVMLTLPVPAHPAPHDKVSLPRYILQLGRLFVVESKELLRIRTLRWLMVSTTAMAFAAGGFNAWLLDFLEREKAMTKESATSLLMVAMVGAVAGIIVGGRLSDRLRSRFVAGRLWTIVIGMTLAIPCTIACLELQGVATFDLRTLTVGDYSFTWLTGHGVNPLYYIAGTANFFFFSWYHAPMAATVDDLAPRDKLVAAQGLVIFTMHLFGTSSSSYVVGVVSDHSSLYQAMWVPAGALVIAALAQLVATGSFAGDHLRARSGEAVRASL
ncbi:MAG TPA: MFS transporter [Kofleriaceae bacterium]|nr:MFS transporter [Kofleriaceae bacterium]